MSLPPLVDIGAAGFRIVLVPVRRAARRRGPPRRAEPTAAPPRPLDLRAAEAQGAAGYGIQQALANLGRARGGEVPVAVVLTRVVVAPDDPAFARPTRAVGPPYSVATARRLARDLGWTFAGNGASRRRVVPGAAAPAHPRGRRDPPLRGCRHSRLRAAGGGVPVIETRGGLSGRRGRSLEE